MFTIHFNLHYSQTGLSILNVDFLFEYYLNLHHSQTENSAEKIENEFEYYLNLHYSQTSNLFLRENNFRHYVTLKSR